MIAQDVKHRLRWYVYTGGRHNERIPHEATMRGQWPGWDVVCSCGWESHTGGGVRAWVKRLAGDHLLDHGIVRWRWL